MGYQKTKIPWSEMARGDGMGLHLGMDVEAIISGEEKDKEENQ